MNDNALKSLLISRNLRELRTERGITQDQLCERLKNEGYTLSRSVYSRYEAGEARIRANIIPVLQKIYGCAYEDFFKDSQKPSQSPRKSGRRST